jgi:hypothetical protein
MRKGGGFDPVKRLRVNVTEIGRLKKGGPRIISLSSVAITATNVHVCITCMLYSLHDARKQTQITAGVTGRQRLLTLPSHLIPPLVCPGIHVCPIFQICIS